MGLLLATACSFHYAWTTVVTVHKHLAISFHNITGASPSMQVLQMGRVQLARQQLYLNQALAEACKQPS